MTERLSSLARGLVGSQILRIAAEVRAMLAEGKPLCNLTVGDFAPAQFPVPARLAHDIARYVEGGQTNYPPSNGLPELRSAVVAFYKTRLGIDVPLEGVVIAAGGRPIIYGAYRTIVNPVITSCIPFRAGATSTTRRLWVRERRKYRAGPRRAFCRRPRCSSQEYAARRCWCSTRR